MKQKPYLPSWQTHNGEPQTRDIFATFLDYAAKSKRGRLTYQPVVDPQPPGPSLLRHFLLLGHLIKDLSHKIGAF